MANERIGTAPCPLCRQPAGVTVSKAELTVLTCNRCHCQLFTRSDVSDERLRSMVTPLAKPEPAQVATPEATEVAPAAPPAVVEEPPAAPAPQPEKRRDSWDIWGGGA